MQAPARSGGTGGGPALAEAAANGQAAVVTRLLERGGADVNAAGKDGTTPLCAAALWGDCAMVRLLLSHGANPNATNSGTLWTPLHAATFQEHGKVVHTLLSASADPMARDHNGRTPVDYATISPGVWPFFGAKGCTRTPKPELVKKGIIRRAAPPQSPSRSHGKILRTDSGSSRRSGGPGMPFGAIAEMSRPGSAYVRVAYDPMRPGSAVGDTVGRPSGGYRPIGAGAANMGAGVGAGAGSSHAAAARSVDPLAHLPMPAPSSAASKLDHAQ